MVAEKKDTKDQTGSKQKDEPLKEIKFPNGVSKDDTEEPELSEEDQALVEKLNLLVERSKDKDLGVRKLALEQIRTEIKGATASMTSVPKPLKFLRDHYQPLREFWFNNDRKSPVSKLMADVLSVMAMTMSRGDNILRQCLKFKLAGEMDTVETWGHEYVRHLAGEIAEEFADIKLNVEREADKDAEDRFEEISIDDLKRLVDKMVPFLMRSNAEADGVDLMTELQMLEDLPKYCDEHNYLRVCLYLESMAPYFTEPEDAAVFTTAYKIYTNHNKPCHAMRIALRLSDEELVNAVLKPGSDSNIKLSAEHRKQLVLDLGAASFLPKFGEEDAFIKSLGVQGEEKEILERLAFNRCLLKHYLQLAKELQVLDPKHPTDIYKQHLIDGGNESSVPDPNDDSARTNLASTYVNAFVNAGFGTDSLLMVDSVTEAANNAEGKDLSEAQSAQWVYKNANHGMMAAAASMGMIQLWDVEEGVNNIDKFVHAKEEFVRAGGLLGLGMIGSRVRNDFDPVSALLEDSIQQPVEESGERKGLMEKLAGIAGLGIAYAGTNGEGAKELLKKIMEEDEDENVAAMASLSLGLLCIGSSDEILSFAMAESLSNRRSSNSGVNKSLVNALFPLSIGLLHLGHGEKVDVAMQLVEAVCGEGTEEEKNCDLSKIAPLILESCAYAGTGNVMKIQKLLGIVGQHDDFDSDAEKEEESKEESKSKDGKEANGPSVNGTTEGANGTGSGSPENANASNTANGAGNAESSSNDSNTDSFARQENASKGLRKKGALPSGKKGPNGESAKEKKEPKISKIAAEQACAVLGIAMISMGEPIGAEMADRIYGHLLHYGEPAVKRSVPIAMGLTSISNPQISLMELLLKMSHDGDIEVAQNAIFALGLIGAGTNNSRIANILRQLSVYYGKDAGSLFLVRIAQAFLHAGKGLVTFNPYHGDGKVVLNKVELAGLLVVLYAALDMKSTLLGKSHYLLYFLALTMRPRMLYTIDGKGEFLPTTVRVGQAVDTVGQAGRPKRITGFQTHSTPVLLAAGERAEFASEEYRTVAADLHDTVVIEKDPNFGVIDVEELAKSGMMEIDEVEKYRKKPSEAGPSSKGNAK